jgi:hypothetical protein
MKQAASLKTIRLPMLIDGIKVNTSPTFSRCNRFSRRASKARPPGSVLARSKQTKAPAPPSEYGVPGGLLHDKLSKPGVDAAASAPSVAGRWSVSDRHHRLMPTGHDLGGLRAGAALLWLQPAPTAGPREGSEVAVPA